MYTAGIYKSSEGRTRWAVLDTVTLTWIFPGRTGKTAARHKAKELNAAASTAPVTAQPLRRFHVYYLNTRTVIEARWEGDAEAIACKRFNCLPQAVKAFATI